MKKQTMFLGIVFLLSFASAIALYSGEEITLTLDEEYEYYTIAGNLTSIELTVTPNGNNVTISVGKYNQNDNFELIFFNQEKEIITQHHYSSGGGGSRTEYVDRNITEYITRNITAYIDKPAEIVYEEVEVIKEKVPLILYGLLLACAIIIFGFIIYQLVWGNKNEN